MTEGPEEADGLTGLAGGKAMYLKAIVERSGRAKRLTEPDRIRAHRAAACLQIIASQEERAERANQHEDEKASREF